MSLGNSFAGFRNGFPFPIIHVTSGVGPGTLWPIGFTLEEFTEFYWRARRFVFSTESLAGGRTSRSFVIDDFESALKFRDDDLTRPECSLVKNDGFTYWTDRHNNVSNFTPPYGSLANPQGFYETLEVDMFGSSTSYKDGLYYPYLDLIASPFINSPGFGALGIGLRTSGETPLDAVLILAFGGLEFEAPLYSDTEGSPYATGTIRLAADSYWGYGGKFDTATGARL
jgi:hypothetical protein